MKRILVIQTAKLGDMVCTTPVFRAIKKEFPGSDLYVMGDSINRQVLHGNPKIYKYVESKNTSTSLFRKINADVVIMLNPNPKILLQLMLSMTPKIIVPKVLGGYSPYVTKVYKILSLFVIRVERHFGRYVPQEYLNMLVPLGINSEDTRKELYFDEKSKSKIDDLLKDYSNTFKIIISPSAGNKIKNWGAKKFASLADEIYKKWKPVIFIIGSDRDRDEVEEMVSSLSPDTKVVDLLSKLSLEELKAFISKSDMFISVDTGPIYIAEAFDVPTVDIIGPIDEREQPPQGQIHKWVISPTRKNPFLFVHNAKKYDVVSARESVESISVGMVLGVVESLFLSVKK